MADIFISYAREDIETAERLADALAAQGWSVFWDRTIPPGQSWRSYIGKALDDARCVIVLWSASSIESEFVLEEADDANRRKVLLPAAIEPVLPPLGFRAIQAADLIRWDGDANANAFLQFLDAVTVYLGPSPAVVADEKPKQGEARRLEEEKRKREEEEQDRQRTEREDVERLAAAKHREPVRASADRSKEEQQKEEVEREARPPSEQPVEDSAGTSAEIGSARTGQDEERNWKPILIPVAVLLLVSSVVGVIGYLAQKDLATMPALTRMAEEEATQRLVDRHYRFSVEKEFSESAEPGIVLRHSPKAGEKFDPDRVMIKLVVSDSIVVPDIVGRTLPAARRLLEEQGLVPGRIEERSVETDRAGQVIEQQPAHGTRVGWGATIDFVVGHEEILAASVPVPQVVGEPFHVAEQVLNEHGLVLGRIEERPVEPRQAGQVVVQNPAAGVSIDRGGSVDLVVGFKEAAEVALTVKTDPPSARIRILNIERPYLPGIRLRPGRYEIEVSHPEYLPFREWIELGAKDEVLEVGLEKIDVRAMGARALRPGEQSAGEHRAPDLVRIPGGCFVMGSPEDEGGREPDELQHEVCVDDFFLARYEVTVAEYRRFWESAGRGAAKTGCYFWNEERWDRDPDLDWRNPGYSQSDDHPVTCVSWDDAMAYIEWLGQETGRTYRLPTEAEWEYAARGSEPAARFWGNEPVKACRFANGYDLSAKGGLGLPGDVHVCDDGFVLTAPVDAPRFEPNPYGLYHMLGNVWEWTCSAYVASYDGSSEKVCATGGSQRVLRGGSWISYPDNLRAAVRGWNYTGRRYGEIGFRLAQDIE
jgi:formylglycine-generating enzyme required for sulfatase activity